MAQETSPTTSSKNSGSQSQSTLTVPTSLPVPPLSALFLVTFDHRKGYVISWSRTASSPYSSPNSASGGNENEADVVPPLTLEGVVEYKSLPSGLHNVEEDLVYFIHENYAGLSAFVSKKTQDASQRNSKMVSVGGLVRLDGGGGGAGGSGARMGRIWRHANGFRDLARKQIETPTPDNDNDNDNDGTAALEDYWNTHKFDAEARSPSLSQPKSPQTDMTSSPIEVQFPNFPNSPGTDGANMDGYQKSRSMSTGTVYLSSETSLAAHHPAATLLEFLSSFGPLIFPLYRAALLRKRILIVTEAPVEFACNIVYNLSILSSIPKALLAYISIPEPSNTTTTNSSNNLTSSQSAILNNLKLQPLFNVGIQDIPILETPRKSQKSRATSQSQSSNGTEIALTSLPENGESWIACTTDDVLGTKPELFDILVFLPSAEKRNNPTKRAYPRIVASSPDLAKAHPKTGIKSTQRDAKRYNNLRGGLKEFVTSIMVEPAETDEDEVIADGDDAISTSSAATSVMSVKEIVEPASWSQVAYESLLWWASAGDRRAGLTEEEELDRERDLALLFNSGDGPRTKEVALVAYFHSLTSLLFDTVAKAVVRTDGDDIDERYRDDDSIHERREEIDDQARLLNQNSLPTEEIEITQEDMSDMGLDVWSDSDREFVQQLVEMWWRRKAVIRGGTIECCGVRIL